MKYPSQSALQRQMRRTSIGLDHALNRGTKIALWRIAIDHGREMAIAATDDFDAESSGAEGEIFTISNASSPRIVSTDEPYLPRCGPSTVSLRGGGGGAYPRADGPLL